MAYFTDFQDYFFLCSDISPEEKRKLNDYLRILEDSGVGEIIAEAVNKDPEKGGRPSYNPYRLFAAMLYAFSKHSGSLSKKPQPIKTRHKIVSNRNRSGTTQSLSSISFRWIIVKTVLRI